MASKSLTVPKQSNQLPARVAADRVIATLSRAENLLKEATTVQQAKVVADVASAQEVFAHRQRLGEECIGYAHRVKIDALTKLGELIKALPKSKGAIGAPGPGRGKRGEAQEPRLSQAATYAELGLDKKTASVAQQLAALPIPVRDAISSREMSMRDAMQPVKRQERVDKIVEISKGNAELLTDVRFPIIYADPPWRYEHVKTENRAIENQYPTMLLEEICALPVKELATPDAALFLWATSPKLAESMHVIDTWGFTYRTCAVWVKDKIGMGYYFRQRHELLLVATRGNLPVPEPSDRIDSVFQFPRLDHSAKPLEFYDVIERMYPEFAKVELFCRNPRHGWAAWGNQAVAS